MMPLGFSSRTRSAVRLLRTIWQKTFSSRTRRAISWPYCEPKSRIKMRSLSGCFMLQPFGRGRGESLLAELAGPEGGGLDGVHEGAADAAAFQGVQAGDGRSAR